MKAFLGLSAGWELDRLLHALKRRAHGSQVLLVAASGRQRGALDLEQLPAFEVFAEYLDAMGPFEHGGQDVGIKATPEFRFVDDGAFAMDDADQAALFKRADRLARHTPRDVVLGREVRFTGQPRADGIDPAHDCRDEQVHLLLVQAGTSCHGGQ